MEIYDRVQAETTKAGLSEPIGWVMLSLRHAWQNRSHDDKAETSRACLVSPEQRFPREVCAHGTQEQAQGAVLTHRAQTLGFEKPRAGTG